MSEKHTNYSNVRPSIHPGSAHSQGECSATTPLWAAHRMSTNPKAERDPNAESASLLTASLSELRFRARLWWTPWRTVSTGNVTQTPRQEFCQSQAQKPHFKIVQQQNDFGGYCYATVGTVDLLQGCLKTSLTLPTVQIWLQYMRNRPVLEPGSSSILAVGPLESSDKYIMDSPFNVWIGSKLPTQETDPPP